MWKSTRHFIALVGLTAMSAGQLPSPGCVDVQAIERVCNRIDAMLQGQPGRRFVEVDSEKNGWIEEPATGHETTAVVYRERRGVVRVDFTIESNQEIGPCLRGTTFAGTAAW